MKKLNWAALLLIFALLLAGCEKADPGVKPLDALFTRAETALAEGQLFFAGRVLEKSVEARQITYYDAETKTNTFYRVEVLEDYFDCLPDRELIVCVMGSTDHFVSRTDLQKDGVYLFNTSVWMQQQEMVLLLPTFYEALPQLEGEYVYYTEKHTRYAVDGNYADYKEALYALAEEQGYGPAAILEGAKVNLQKASERNAAYFDTLKFKNTDRALADATAAAAAVQLKKAETTEATDAGIEELLK